LSGRRTRGAVIGNTRITVGVLGECGATACGQLNGQTAGGALKYTAATTTTISVPSGAFASNHDLQHRSGRNEEVAAAVNMRPHG
jgi:hypothetical protein